MFSYFLRNKIAAVLMAVLTATVSVISASAAEAVSFSLSDVEVRTNRLFDVDVTATGNMKLCAATFVFRYTSNVLEFRKVTAAEGCLTEVYDTGGECRVSFLSKYGVDIKNGSSIFSIKFKAVEKGSAGINFSVFDCVNSDVSFVDIGSCKSANVLVSSGSDSGSASGNSKKLVPSGFIQHGASADSGTQPTTTAEERKFDLLNDVVVVAPNYLLVFVVMLIAIVALAWALIWFIIKYKRQMKERDARIPFTEIEDNPSDKESGSE